MIDFIKDLILGKPFGGRSPQWSGVRNKYIKQNPICAVCGRTKKLEIHHIIPYHVLKEFELEESNLITLCREHHYFIGHLNSWYSWNKDVAEDAKNWYNKISTRP